MKAQVFEFTSYSFVGETGSLSLVYTMKFEDAEPIVFTELIQFPHGQKLDPRSQPLLNRILENIHLMLGISYYKTYLPPRVEIPYKLSKEQSVFWSAVYKNGLGEFLYRNNLDPEIVAIFPSFDASIEAIEASSLTDSLLVGIGGGKDSIVVAELLRAAGHSFSTFFIQYQKKSPSVVDEVIKKMGVDHTRIIRTLDPKLSGTMPGTYNGHIPASGIFAFLGLAAALLNGQRYIVVGNEYSSNFGNGEYKGMQINHQWSKSQEFEDMFSQYVRRFITPDISYFSALRPFYEFRIVRMFAKYEEYFNLFSSCNTNYTLESKPNKSKWCGRCAKCAFMFLMLAAHLPKKTVVQIFGTNMLDNESLIPIFKDVLGLGSLKPFDCVGTFDEAILALQTAERDWHDTCVVRALKGMLVLPDANAKEILRTHTSLNIPTKFAFLGMANALILGYGKEGKITEEYIEKTMPQMQIGIADKSINSEYLELQNSYDIAVKTPGIPKRNVHIQYTTATNIFFSQTQKNMTIGITGTKGKSTTASLIYSILKRADRDVRLVGNIGAPMLGALLTPFDDNTVFVVELSSYQLDDAQFSPRIGVFLNLFPEHMDYHGGVKEYYEAKNAIFRYQRSSDALIYNAGSKIVSSRTAAAPSIRIPFADPLPIDDGEIPLLGEHNKDNVRAAVAVARQMRIDDDIIRTAIKTFVPLPHRLELIGEFNGVQFYDDAISTTPESTIAAIKALPTTNTIFLGGEDRGYDFAALEQFILSSQIQNIVLFPNTGKRMFLQRPKNIQFLETSSMKDAVSFAFKHTKNGTICLLSTASPSYSLWKNFEEKGDEFKKWVRSEPHHAS